MHKRPTRYTERVSSSIKVFQSYEIFMHPDFDLFNDYDYDIALVNSAFCK